MRFEETDFLYAVIFAGELNGYDPATEEMLTPLETATRLAYNAPVGFNLIELAAMERKYQINKTNH